MVGGGGRNEEGKKEERVKRLVAGEDDYLMQRKA